MFKKRLLVIIIIIMLLLSIFPNITSQSFKTRSEETVLSPSLNIQNTKINRDVTLNIMFKDTDGNFEKVLKKVSRSELYEIKKNVTKIVKSDLGYKEKFEYVLEELKENYLISNNIQLEDIIDITQFENNPLKFNNVTNKNFVAHFAPIIAVGGGIGLGVGYMERRLTNAFSHFLSILAGFAIVFCLDFLAETAYILFTMFFLPLFIGYIAGFTGIIMFAVYPGLFYSNLLMIGFAPFAYYLSIPEMEDE